MATLSFYGFNIWGTNVSDHSDVDFDGLESKGEKVNGQISNDHCGEEAVCVTDSLFLTSFCQLGLSFTFQMSLST